jgi:ACS family hexuronate transporter-like MFS transporter
VPKPRWRDLLGQRRTWAFVVAKTLTDAVWWFMLFWLPDLLHKVFQLDMRSSGAPLAIVYALAAAGALSGGWLPGVLMRRGFDLQRARMTTLLVAALCVLPVPLALGVQSYWVAALIVGLGLAAHQAFSTNVFALAGDLFPRAFTASVVGLGALFGNVGGFLMLEITGRVLHATGSYFPMFAYCAGAYVVGWLVIRTLVRRFPPRVDGEVVA